MATFDEKLAVQRQPLLSGLRLAKLGFERHACVTLPLWPSITRSPSALVGGAADPLLADGRFLLADPLPHPGVLPPGGGMAVSSPSTEGMSQTLK